MRNPQLAEPAKPVRRRLTKEEEQDHHSPDSPSSSPLFRIMGTIISNNEMKRFKSSASRTRTVAKHFPNDLRPTPWDRSRVNA